MIHHKGYGASKEELAERVSIGLKKALTESNIMKGFAVTSIWPLNPAAMDSFMTPSAFYVEPSDEQEDDVQDIDDGRQEENCIYEIQ